MAITSLRDETARLLETRGSSSMLQVARAAEQVQQGLRSLWEAGGSPAQTLKTFLHGTWLGHPLHATLTDIPVGSWALTAVFDLFGQDKAADACLTAGCIAAVPTAMAGAADWTDTEGTSRDAGLVHAALNSVALVLFVGSIVARKSGNRATGVALSTSGLALATVSAYLGGDIVYHQGTGVNRNAFDPETDQWRVAAKESDLVEGQLVAGSITVNGAKLAVALHKQGKTIHAISGTCSHWGGPLAKGKIVNGTCVQCPWHGSEFRLEDGHVQKGPAAFSQTMYEARLNGGNVEVRKVR